MSCFSIAVSLPIFLVINYINSNVSTDLVVVDKPETINSYDDVINSDMKVFMARIFTEWQKFDESPVGSIQHRLSKNIVKFNFYGDDFPRIFTYASRKEGVLLGRGVATTAVGLGILNTMCDNNPSARWLSLIDTNAKKYTNVIIVNKNAPARARKAITKTSRALLESGSVNHIYDIAAGHIIGHALGYLPYSVHRKITKIVEEQKVDPQPIGLSNIYNIITLYFAMIIFNIAILGIEMGAGSI